MSESRAVKIAVTAMGGQGGGVLSNWIVKLGERAGYVAQSTSVPGVAQRTGATVYYVELFPEAAVEEKGKPPVLALMPASGDVDIVIAAEFMEAGRAVMRGLVSERTTLIASSHRDYAISEKIGMGDARQSVDGIRDAIKKAAGRYIEADMAGAAEASGAVISAVMFGALAGSGALSISREVFETTIKSSGRNIEANMKGFTNGVELVAAAAPSVVADTPPEKPMMKPSPAVAPLIERMREELPVELHETALEALKRCVDYQDIAYANEYLGQLAEIVSLDRDYGQGQNFFLSALVAKHLALWMTYEDAVRVADLKTRTSRFGRFREDVKAEEGQIVTIYEYLHPRVEEVCDILPAAIARGILSGNVRRKILKALLGDGRRVPTTKLRGFLQLWAISKLRFMRRSSFRFAIERARIRQWVDWVKQYAPQSYDLACELAALQRLLKGYGDTHERGLANYNRIMASIEDIARQANPGAALSSLRDAALSDEDGAALDAALTQLTPGIQAAE